MSDVTHALALAKFAALFTGYPNSYGTGTGGWVHKPPVIERYAEHVAGRGPGLGIGPLMPDGNCWFGSIDLDRPDFDLAWEFMGFVPGVSWLERSRSGNAHVHVFFDEPVEAWIVRGILRAALEACGERQVEVFPKSDMLHPGMVGNYINLPYYGDTRPIIGWRVERKGRGTDYRQEISFSEFVFEADARRNRASDWRKRTKWLCIVSPSERKQAQAREFGQSSELHRCASYIIEHREDNPVVEGHRAAVYFALAKMLANWSEIDHDEAEAMLALVNDASPDPIPEAELNRILFNAERGQFTSTSCDDPLVLAYADPECPIAHPERRK
jgi:hypothetical protein